MFEDFLKEATELYEAVKHVFEREGIENKIYDVSGLSQQEQPQANDIMTTIKYEGYSKNRHSHGQDRGEYCKSIEYRYNLQDLVDFANMVKSKINKYNVLLINVKNVGSVRSFHGIENKCVILCEIIKNSSQNEKGLVVELSEQEIINTRNI